MQKQRYLRPWQDAKGKTVFSSDSKLALAGPGINLKALAALDQNAGRFIPRAHKLIASATAFGASTACAIAAAVEFGAAQEVTTARRACNPIHQEVADQRCAAGRHAECRHAAYYRGLPGWPPSPKICDAKAALRSAFCHQIWPSRSLIIQVGCGTLARTDRLTAVLVQ
jgi:hypothetical protein